MGGCCSAPEQEGIPLESTNAGNIPTAAETEQIETSQAIVDSVNMTCPTGRLTDGLYDTYGNHYIIPDYCIGIIENTNKSIKTELNDFKSLKSFSELDTGNSEDGYSITVRLSTGSDIIITVDPEMTIATLKALVGKSLGYTVADLKKLMVIHFGKVLENSTVIKDTKIVEKSVVQVMVLTV
ncbi:Ubiquitin domain-containing protein 2 [Boothiomyces sp. JEL0838]|nr:Ubiquitin domain-containing protein 2 [Boothiomyces sp. JEL0838]